MPALPPTPPSEEEQEDTNPPTGPMHLSSPSTTSLASRHELRTIGRSNSYGNGMTSGSTEPLLNSSRRIGGSGRVTWKKRVKDLPRHGWNWVEGSVKSGLRKYKKAGIRGKVAFWSILTINLAIILAIIIITPHRIGVAINNLAEHIKDLGNWGMVVLFFAVVIASHPPLFGFGFSMTMIGFVYGLPLGFVLGSLASLTGAGVAFLSVRTFFLERMKSMGGKSSTQWEAFGQVVKAKGTLLIIMIRWCPVPWALGNGLFASIESVTLSSFMLANLLVQPRLLLPVFIGSRIHSLSGGEEGPPDPIKKWINIGSIVVGISLSFLTGSIIYKSTLKKMKELQAGLTEEEESAARHILEENALLGDYSGDEESDNDNENGGDDDEPLSGALNANKRQRQVHSRVESV